MSHDHIPEERDVLCVGGREREGGREGGRERERERYVNCNLSYYTHAIVRRSIPGHV